MFNLDEFENSPILEKVEKLNKYLIKNKSDKIQKAIKELENLLDQRKDIVPITYILSILAENRLELISEQLIQKIGLFLHSDNQKLQINSLIIIGFAMLANSKYIDVYFHEFTKFLTNESNDIRNNIHYFLLELVKSNPNLSYSLVDNVLMSFSIEKNDYNIISLLELLEFCDELEFDQLYNFRDVSKSIISAFQDTKVSEIYTKLKLIIKKYFPSFENLDWENQDSEKINFSIEDQFLMKKHNFTSISKNSDIILKDYMKKFAKSNLKDKKVYFYMKTKDNVIFIYELEKSKLHKFFETEIKISNEKISKMFSNIIDNDSELKRFIKTLIKLKIVKGYYSDTGFFYPYGYIKSKFLEDLQEHGSLNVEKFNFIPRKFIEKSINDISEYTNQKFLKSKDNVLYFSLKKIQNEINIDAAKNTIIDLKSYRDILTEEDFIKLIKRLPKEYLSDFHKGTQWLTNLGIQKITNEVQNSKIVGYFDISKISEKLNIGQLLLLDVFDQFVDLRSGIWDKTKTVFYYSKYVKDRINEINVLVNEIDKSKQINKISNDLNIDKNHILTKIDENLQLIAEEIKQKDQIRINEYLEKTGMEIDSFLKFIDDLNISYFKKADLLIFNPTKIEEAKNEIKHMLIDKSKSNEFISIGTYDLQSKLIKDLINDLIIDGKMKGIFYENNGEGFFYTERGIRKLMIENSFLFSFHDLFYGKELNQTEIELLREIFDDLIKDRKIKGTFDEETLTFSSDDVIFAKDYNTIVFEFEKMVNNHTKMFETEFQKIKKILIKKQETIYPQEIKVIQEIIDRINEKYINWRSGLEAFIRKMNKKLLREQGVSVRKHKNHFIKEKQEEVKSLEEDPEVFELMDKFNGWIKLFNKLELKYPNIIFYQKRLINNPKDEESNNKLNELLAELNLV
ncbi:MAG: hypothetical protein ACFE9I_14205 [Candidatus Hermodarchaeota archaeon]